MLLNLQPLCLSGMATMLMTQIKIKNELEKSGKYSEKPE